jgi:hypothetical protein
LLTESKHALVLVAYLLAAIVLALKDNFASNTWRARAGHPPPRLNKVEGSTPSLSFTSFTSLLSVVRTLPRQTQPHSSLSVLAMLVVTVAVQG